MGVDRRSLKRKRRERSNPRDKMHYLLDQRAKSESFRTRVRFDELLGINDDGKIVERRKEKQIKGDSCPLNQ